MNNFTIQKLKLNTEESTGLVKRLAATCSPVKKKTPNKI